MSHSERVKASKTLFGGRKLEVIKDNLTNAKVDGLVYPTDAAFKSCGPAGDQLMQAYGTKLKEEIKTAFEKHGSLRPCDSYVSKVKSLKSSKYLIFCNLPKYSGDNMKRRLGECICNCLQAASSAGLKSVGIPMIGFDYPGSIEGEQVIRGVADFHFKSPRSSVTKIEIYPLDEDTMFAYSLEVAKIE